LAIEIKLDRTHHLINQPNPRPTSERAVAVTQRSSTRYRHWPFRCCSSPDSHNRNAHIGLAVLPPFRRRGYGTDTIRALCHYGFITLRLRRLQVETVADNMSMIKAATRAGSEQKVCCAARGGPTGVSSTKRSSGS
jgi:predicted acetyltransferase